MGANKDGSVNSDYCIYCYEGGSFTDDVTMEEMINISLEHMRELFKEDKSFNDAKAIKDMELFFPMLKRWKNS